MYVVDDELSIYGVRQFMSKVWNFFALPELYYMDDGYFIIRFKTKDEVDDVMAKGPYAIYKQTMFLKYWSANFVLKDNLLRVIPIGLFGLNFL